MPKTPATKRPAGKSGAAGAPDAANAQAAGAKRRTKPAPETGGPAGPEPTRYGDWERKGICSDF